MILQQFLLKYYNLWYPGSQHKILNHFCTVPMIYHSNCAVNIELN